MFNHTHLPGDKARDVSSGLPTPLTTSRGVYTWMISPPESIPTALYEQVLSRYRAEWPLGFVGENEGRTWVAKPLDSPLHIGLLSEDGSVASHAAFVNRGITIGSSPYRACGIMGVFTQPGHAWLAPEIVRYVSEVLVPSSGCDIAMGFCSSEELIKWYGKFGLSPMLGARVRVDPRNNEPTIIDDEVLLAHPLTPAGSEGLERLRAGEELYFGPRPTW